MIRRLLLLNGIAIIGVILNHTAGWGFTALFWWTDRYAPVSVPNFDQIGSAAYYGLRAIEQLVIVSIPAFLFVSGFFIASATGRSRDNIEWKVIGVRISNLLIPYLIWSFIFFGFDLAQGSSYSAIGYFRRLVFGRTTTGYYYVPLLTQLLLLAPLIVPLAKKQWRGLLIGTAIIQIGVLALRYPAILGTDSAVVSQLVAWTPSWFFPGHIFWFSLGVVIGFNLKHFKEWLDKVKWFALAVSIFTFILGIIEWELLFQFSGKEWIAPTRTFIDELFSAALLITFLAFGSIKYPFQNLIGQLGAKSYGIYLIHTLPIVIAARGLYHFVPTILGIQPIYQFILILGAFSVPLIIMWVINHSPFRPYYRYIFG